jgi:hypothetical protein
VGTLEGFTPTRIPTEPIEYALFNGHIHTPGVTDPKVQEYFDLACPQCLKFRLPSDKLGTIRFISTPISGFDDAPAS